jgi:hypothetical protein
MKKPILIALCVLGVQLFVRAEDQKVKAVADVGLAGMNAANLEGLKRMAEREVYATKDNLISSLKDAPSGTGILFDVEIYERTEGGHWSPGPLRLGRGQSMFEIVKQTEEHAREHGAISKSPPSGFFYSKSKSYMLWAILEGKTLKVRTMSPANRELLYATVRNRLAEQTKPEVKTPR